MRILLVEDDELLGDGVFTGIRNDGHTVDWLRDGLGINKVLTSEAFDMMILDLGLPHKSGFAVLDELRGNGSDMPVLILTARDSIEDRVAGLDKGADDYVTKPFDLDELLARIRALQRRLNSRADPVLSLGEISLNPASHCIKFKGEPLTLPRREFALLQKLLENAGRVLSRDHLRQTLYGWREDVDSNALEVHIHNLRKKFGNRFIRTIRGVGYLITKDQDK